MDCEICLEQFDHNKHRPYSLSPCAHTLCIDCINKIIESNTLNQPACPLCKKEITGTNTNWSLLKIIPESSFDKLKQNLDNCLNKTSHLNKQLIENRENKVQENSTKLDQIRVRINTRLNELITVIQNEKVKLMEQTDNIENFLEKKLYSLKLPTEQDEINDLKSKLKHNQLDESRMKHLILRLEEEMPNLTNKINEIEKLNYDDFIFDETERNNVYFLGEIKNKNWVLKNPNATDYINIGFQINEQLKDHKKAIEYLNKAIEIEPNFAFPYYNKGLLLLQRKQYDGALECFDKSIQLNPSYANAYNGKGRVLFEQNNHLSAIICFNRAIEMDPCSAVSYYNKGLALVAQNNKEEALNFFYKALDIDPNNDDYVNARKNICG